MLAERAIAQASAAERGGARQPSDCGGDGDAGPGSEQARRREVTWFKMFSKWNWSIQAVCVILSIYSFGVSGVFVPSCGHIEPESPLVSIGSNFTAYCILGPRCNGYGDIHANQIIWKMRTELIPKEQYHVINQTVSSVTFNNITKLLSPLTCNLLVAGNIEQNIYGIQVRLGLPPDKPKNLSCIVYQIPTRMISGKFDITCTWEPGRYTWLNTSYLLKHRWQIQEFPDCIPRGTNSSCTISNVQFFIDLEVWVVATNELGKKESAHIQFDPSKYVKPLPPKNLSAASGEFSTALRLSWQNQFSVHPLSLTFNIHYKNVYSMNWIEVPLEDTGSQRTSFIVQELKPHTEYTFRVRCTINNCSNCSWSDWSNEVVGLTGEFKPSKGPDVWRKIDAHSPGNWTLLLMWKELNPSEANGIIRKYNVTVMGKPLLSFPPEFYSVNTTELTLNVPNGTYEVRVTAYNNAGGSPTSVLLIPAVNSKAPVKDVKVFPKDDKLWVEWSPPGETVNKYIIEWCEDCNNMSHWQQEPGSAQRTFLRGDIKPFKRYTITVNPLYANGQGEERSMQAYLQQDAPAMGPAVRTKKVGKSEAVLEWKPLPVEEQKGFIRYYAISYKTMSENETVVRVEPSKTEYELSSLKSSTLYMVQVAAYTDEGGKSGPTLTFTTQKFAEGEIEAIVVPVCLAFLIITLLGVLFCFNKRDIIKKHIWPNVPDPSKSVIAQWSPQTPSKHFHSKDQVYPEGSFTDVSVVEIEADDKKLFSEQPFDLLRNEKNASEGHSSGIGGSSCMSSPQQSVSDSDEGEPAQNTSSTVQYSTVVPSGYRDQIPSVQVFSRSESTQPLLDSEERSEDQQVLGSDNSTSRDHYFKQNCNQDETTVDESHLERVKQISPINEEDLAGQAPQKYGSSPEREEQGIACPSAFHPSLEGPTLQVETTINTVTDELPKCYLPQTVRLGGYMPQ